MKYYQAEVCRYQPKPMADVDNHKLRLNNSSYHVETEFNNCFIIYPQANGAKRRSGRKPGARVTNSARLFTPG